MCGIIGIFQPNKNNKQQLLNLIKSIEHRGPQYWSLSNEHVSLGNTRLKVVDLNEDSNQPFFSKDKRYIVVFNGEIYNHRDLKQKYKIFTTTDSDTELIVELFSKIGVKCFELFDGMFSIAIFDIKKSKLYLSRDPFGIKPLYYSTKNKKFIFCSEIKGINDENNRYKQNDSSIINFIKWGGLDHSNQTWFKDIRSIKPGTLIIIDKNLSILEKNIIHLMKMLIRKKLIQKI